LVALGTTAAAQWLNYPTPGIPRTADGKPNLTAPEILAKYVGVYKGVWARRPLVVEIALRDDTLFVSEAGGEPERLVPQSETSFFARLGYTFIRDNQGIATDVVEKAVSGDYPLHRQK
jgi:hypothetical protein